MHIYGAIQRELDAAREEGRREGLRKAIAVLNQRLPSAIWYTQHYAIIECIEAISKLLEAK